MHVAFYRGGSLLCTCLLHTFSKRWFSYRGKRNLDYRCVYVINNVICVKTGLDWQNLRFKMERIRKKGKQDDSSDVTFRFFADNRRIGRLVVTYQSQFVANSYLLLWAMMQST